MKIFFDYDNTLNNFVFVWVDWIRREHGIKIETSDIEHYEWISENFGKEMNQLWLDPEVYSITGKPKISPLPGMEELVSVCMDKFGEENVKIITTSPKNQDLRWMKEAHIEHFFGIKSDNVIHAIDKHNFTGNNILVEDYYYNAQKHVEVNPFGHSILFNYEGFYGGWSRGPKHERIIERYTAYGVNEAIERIIEYNGTTSLR